MPRRFAGRLHGAIMRLPILASRQPVEDCDHTDDRRDTAIHDEAGNHRDSPDAGRITHPNSANQRAMPNIAQNTEIALSLSQP